jgi:hypothetical protein
VVKYINFRIGFWQHWLWFHWFLLGIVLLVSSKTVYDKQVARISALEQVDVDVIEENIQEYNMMAERMVQLEVLPPVQNQWQFIPAIANRYGVMLRILGEEYPGMYKGPLEAWHGEISGRVGAVLVAASEIQQTVPTYLYNINIKNGEATLGFSVLGSE